METLKTFIYSWHIDESEEEVTSIRIFGIDENNRNICLKVNNFTPYVYIELPKLPGNFEWNVAKAQLLGNKIDEILGRHKPLEKTLEMKHKLYFAHVNNDMSKKLFPYLRCSFSSRNDIKMLGFKLRRPVNIIGVGAYIYKMHEQDADPVIQLCSTRDIPTAGWVVFRGKRVPDKETICDHEFIVRYENIKKSNSDKVAKPKIMGFDIEVNSTNPSAMPKAVKPGDKIFQISCVFARDGEEHVKYILSLGDPEPSVVGEDVVICTYLTESELILGFTELIREENPNIIAGYNILTFDIPYMIARSKFNFIFDGFALQGFHKFKKAKERVIKWSSSAYKNQEFEFLDAEGRLFVDLLPLVKRDYKLDNYKLKTVSEYFIGQTKDDLSVKGIFKCYRVGIQKDENGGYSKRAQKAMGICAKYCVQDSVLVVLLMEKLQTWIGLCEMAKTCQVPIFALYTQGQQIKVFSQIYKFCFTRNIVVEKDGYITGENERYMGAHVFAPVPGIYDRVLPFDFASLYPTTIIAYNIDYSTLVLDDAIPNHLCHVMEWTEHIGCIHDEKVIRKNKLSVLIDIEKEKIKDLRKKRDKTLNKLSKKEYNAEIAKITDELAPYIKERSDINKSKPKFITCADRKYRFLKEPKGVMPTVLENLLSARENTKNEMKTVKTRLKDIENIPENESRINELKCFLNVLDKRQLAYKVSANSMYGAMGVRRGYLPFMPGAMCTTYMGRQNIEKVAETIQQKFRGELVYGDTDCLIGCTPVLIKHDSFLQYKTVEEISDGNWTRINPNKEISNAKPGYQIWSDQGFTDIVNVVRCGILKPLSRVLTHVGEVTCSNEHSLLRDNLESVTPLDLELKDKLCISELPLPSDTPNKPIYNNKLTAQIIREYIIPNEEYGEINAELAFVWGMFFADGSCGTYVQKEIYSVHTWAINKQDTVLLGRCMDILIRNEPEMEFRILDTMESSHVCKLTARQKSRTSEHMGDLKDFVERYRELFYDSRKYKKVPDIILNAPLGIRQSFFMGYYAGDGSKKDPALTLTNKGAIGSAGLFYLLRSLGYNVSVNTRQDKPDIYKLTGSSPDKKLRKIPNAVKKIVPMEGEENGYIYDIQTGNHHFAAGVGQLVVHNSNYIHFPHLETAQESWEYAEMVAEEVSKLFPPPIRLAFEEVIYWRFFILTKKRYMYTSCGKDGIVNNKIGKKGVLLARRDNSMFIRNLYEEIIKKLFAREQRDDILYFILQEFNKLFSNSFNIKNFVVTKAIGSTGDLTPQEFVNEKGVRKMKIGDYTTPVLSVDIIERERQLALKDAVDESEYYVKCLPAQVQLAEKMRRRGQRVDIGTRLEYVITEQGGINGKQYDKIESSEYFMAHSNILSLDFMYYLKLCSNPIDQVLNVVYGKDSDFNEDFVLDQYNIRKKRGKLIEEIKKIFSSPIIFEN